MAENTNTEREAFSCFNTWFTSLPEGRQAVLREDKWMLAHAAFEAGRASLSLPAAEQEPVAWGIFDSQGFYEAATDQESAERFCAHYNKRKGADPLKPYTANPLYAAPQPAVAAGWVMVDERLPEPGKPVLLDIGKKFPIRAMWAAKHTVEAHDETEPEWTEYDEATDQHYCPQGWYEWNEHEEVHWAVNQTPRAWCELPQPLPPAPSTEGEGNG